MLPWLIGKVKIQMTFMFIFLNSYLLFKKLKDFSEKGSLIISAFLYCVTVARDCYEWGRGTAKETTFEHLQCE